MKSNWLTAGALAGVAMYFWSFVSHTLLPLGEAGITPMTPDSPVLASLQQGLAQPGMYFFPYETDQAKAAQAYATKPHGILFYTPAAGKPFNFPANLGVQFATALVCGSIAAFLIFSAGPMSFGKRVLFGLLLGLFAGFTVHIPFWNWYGAPLAYVLPQMLDLCVGGAVGGSVIAWMAARKDQPRRKLADAA